jgi:hypothetical protein
MTVKKKNNSIVNPGTLLLPINAGQAPPLTIDSKLSQYTDFHFLASVFVLRFHKNVRFA